MRVLDDEDKTVARLHVDTAAGDDVTTARVSLSPLRGYDRETGRAGALLASVNGVTPAATSTDARGSPALAPAITADMPAAAAIAARAPDVPRHRRGQRAGRARRHRHRVPSRSSGRRASRPFDREAGRRHPARTPAAVGAVGGRSEVARRRHDADPRPRRLPPRRARHGRAPAGGPAAATSTPSAPSSPATAPRRSSGCRPTSGRRASRPSWPGGGRCPRSSRATRRPARRRSSSAPPGCAAPTAG